jgi:hypothetical protein
MRRCKAPRAPQTISPSSSFHFPQAVACCSATAVRKQHCQEPLSVLCPRYSRVPAGSWNRMAVTSSLPVRRTPIEDDALRVRMRCGGREFLPARFWRGIHTHLFISSLDPLASSPRIRLLDCVASLLGRGMQGRSPHVPSAGPVCNHEIHMRHAHIARRYRQSWDIALRHGQHTTNCIGQWRPWSKQRVGRRYMHIANITIFLPAAGFIGASPAWRSSS